MDNREFDLDLFDTHINDMEPGPDARRMHMHRESIRKLLAERDTLKALCVELQKDAEVAPLYRWLKYANDTMLDLWACCKFEDRDDWIRARIADAEKDTK